MTATPFPTNAVDYSASRIFCVSSLSSIHSRSHLKILCYCSKLLERTYKHVHSCRLIGIRRAEGVKPSTGRWIADDRKVGHVRIYFHLSIRPNDKYPTRVNEVENYFFMEIDPRRKTTFLVDLCRKQVQPPLAYCG